MNLIGMFNSDASQVNVPAVLVANGLGACLMLAILLGRRKRLRAVTYDGRFFYWMCRICLVLCILETASFLLDGRQFAGGRQLTLVFNVIILLLAAVISFLWVCFVDYKLFEDHGRLRRIYPFVAIPAVLIILLSAVNLFFDVFFGVDNANVYYRTSLFFLPCVVIYCYMTYGVILSLRYKSRVDKYLFMPVLAFLIPIYLGSLIQLCYYGIALIWVSTALGLTFLYISLQNEESYLDPLTDLYNRSYLLNYMAHRSRHAKGGVHTIGIMLDVNDFKQINDTYGHIEGDAVLRAVGKLLIRATKGSAVVVRYGGDEFVVLLENAAPETVQRIQARIEQEVLAYNASGSAPMPLSLSAGTAEFDKVDFFHFFQEMDRNMYEKKRSFYLQREQDKQ